MKVLVKDPDATIDYTVDWNDGYLETDSLAEEVSASEWLVDPNDSPTIAIESDGHDETSATVMVSGGSRGCTYRLTNRITTSRGRTDDRSITIRVEPT